MIRDSRDPVPQHTGVTALFANWSNYGKAAADCPSAVRPAEFESPRASYQNWPTAPLDPGWVAPGSPIAPNHHRLHRV